MVRMVRLHNGAEEAEALVQDRMLALNALAKERTGLFGTFVAVVCGEDPKGEHQEVLTKWTSGVEELKRRTLMEADGTINDATKAVILSAVVFHRDAKGEVVDIGLRNPIVESDPNSKPTAKLVGESQGATGACVNASQFVP